MLVHENQHLIQHSIALEENVLSPDTEKKRQQISIKTSAFGVSGDVRY